MNRFPETDLTTGGPNPFLPALLDAINHADDIAISVAFIRMTGLRLIEGTLQDALERSCRVRILTSDYLGVTEPKALRQLMLLQEKQAMVRVFESGEFSFHMKAYLFTKGSDAHQTGCAFVGSSNLSHTALLEGIEWNLKVDQHENPSRFQHLFSEFELLFADPRCKRLTHPWIDLYAKRCQSLPRAIQVPGSDEVEPVPTPYPIQLEALQALARTRSQGFARGLVVLATGMGKTWLAAFDSQQMNAKRILFVAHREEILDQAEATFIRIRPDDSIGRYCGSKKDVDVDVLFASVQTLHRLKHLRQFGPEFFDYIVIDEFHHAAAATYRKLLNHFEPSFLLGLTATPDRSDQTDILRLCDHNMVFQKDLFEGIRSQVLCPFHYFGIADREVDYQSIPWRNQKFDPKQLSFQLATHARARHNLEEWRKHRLSRTLGFCVSTKHANFMADYFLKHGHKAVAVHSRSSVRRHEALEMLGKGQIHIIFSVDFFNEGVDLPAVDTILMLRPTESKIVFLQQLGRGLRTCENPPKDHLVVLDFIGNHHSFFRKPEALFGMGVTDQDRRRFIRNVQEQDLELPEGCFVNFDLESIEFMKSFLTTKLDRQVEIFEGLMESFGRRPTMTEFYRSGGSVERLRREHGSWFQFLIHQQQEMKDDLVSVDEQACVQRFSEFLVELESTSMTKSFKMVLLETFLNFDGFRKPLTTRELAEAGHKCLMRKPALHQDVPDKFLKPEEWTHTLSREWHSYWRANPINAWIGGNRKDAKAYFRTDDGSLRFVQEIPVDLVSSFSELIQEVIDFRLFQYETRSSEKMLNPIPSQNASPSSQRQEIHFFSDLKIACGHFRSSRHDDHAIQTESLPLSYGKLDLSRHFLAQAGGDSMDGGKNPIKDGDFLLLELISPTHAGSNQGQILAIERQDETGEDQYLLRKIQKSDEGNYRMIALNPDYPEMTATEDMRPFARLKAVVPKYELHLHKTMMREQIPALFGMTFNKGLWQSWHICPKSQANQILLVTLNKQGLTRGYNDYFQTPVLFHWQSQDSTAVSSSKGQRIIHHQDNGGLVHLFVRKTKMDGSKAAPFIYCGLVDYQSHQSERPMNVIWKLQDPLSNHLFEHLK